MSSTQDGVTESGWPLTGKDRTWTTKQLTVVLLVTACGNWSYLIGQYVAFYLDFKMGVAALIAGSMIGMLMLTLAVVPISTKYGIDSIAASKPQFGNRGWLITVFLQYASIIGWNALLLVFFGKAVAQAMITLGMAEPETSLTIVRVVSAITCAVVYLVLLRGLKGLEAASNLLFFVVIGIGTWMLYQLLSSQADALAVAKPSMASSSLSWNYVTGVEISIVSLLGFWAYFGTIVREAPSPSSSVLPSMLAMGLSLPLLSIVGLAAMLVLQVPDPTAWLVSLGGPLYGLIALLLIMAANLGPSLAGVYSTAMGLRRVPALGDARWSTLILFSIVPVAAVGIFIPEEFFSNFGTFLAFIGVFFAPLCAIQIADTFLLRRNRINVRGIYEDGPDTPYHFWGGFNPAALLAMVAGFATYLYLLNPVSYESRWPYEYTTASLPAALVAGIVFVAVTRLVVMRFRKGDYR
ncbi:cytosine permease [Hyphomicrobium sp. 99]|uniref:cytosine permease n=1 Tax=Hyphomicrobium sp. 99 TaxID=1163419 RepID=UPI0005F7C9F1|nr:cytosine permease [Hyphomicrobium sp. 99]